VFQGTAQPSPDRLRALASSAPREAVLLPFLTRGHWLLLALREYGLPSARVEVLDSAPSHPVARDVARVVRLLGLPPPVHLSLPQQVRNSNDCGVFVILFASAILQRLVLPARGYLQGDMFRAALGDPAAFQARVRALANHSPQAARARQERKTSRRAEPTFSPSVVFERPAVVPPPPTPTPSASSYYLPSSARTLARRNDPYATGPLPVANPPARQGGAPPLAISIDDTPEVEHALSRLTHAQATYTDALGYNRTAMLHATDLDALLLWAALDVAPAGVGGLAVLSSLDRTPPPGRFIQPLWLGLQADRGHFVLLHAPGDGTAALYDSAPGFLPGQALALARQRLPTIPIRVITTAQGENECGFVVCNVARRLLAVTHLPNPLPGACRARYAPPLIAHHLDALKVAYAALANIARDLTTCGVTVPDEVLSLLSKVAAMGVVPLPADASVAHSSGESTPAPAATTQAHAPVPSAATAPRPVTLHTPPSTTRAPPPDALRTTPATTSVVVGPPSTPQNTSPRALSHGGVRAILRTRPIGTLVRVRWANRLDAGEWWGRVVRKSEYGVQAQICFTASRCDQCGSIMPIDPDLTIAMPTSGIVYFEVEIVDHLPTMGSCGCDSEASSVASFTDRDSSETDCASDSSSESDLETVSQPLVECETRDARTDHSPSLPSVTHHVDDLFGEERAAAALPEHSASVSLKTALHTHIFNERPAHVPLLAWRKLSDATRRLHIRWLRELQSILPPRCYAPVATAVIHHVTGLANSRRWRWSTISSTLSTIASALASLPLYSRHVGPCIDLRNDPIFATAMARAAHLARVSRVEHPTPIMTWTEFERLRTACKGAAVRLLLEVAWFFAARVGDARKLLRRDVEVTLEAPLSDRQQQAAITATFRLGKGAAFAGPYTVRALVPVDVAQRLAGWLAPLSPNAQVWTSSTQRSLSALTNASGFPLRAVRRGMLVHLAQRGVKHEALMLLSGHKNAATLMHYLGWGRDTDRVAAEARADAYGGEPLLGPRMGSFSGVVGRSGQRVRPPPEMFPRHAPDLTCLTAETPAVDPTWPLHVKPVGVVNWDEVFALAKAVGCSFVESLQCAHAWVSSARFYGSDVARHSPSIMTRLRVGDLETLRDAGKIEPCLQPLNFCSAWLLPQPSKKRFRPIFEPFLNSTLSMADLPVLRYPSRLERRATLRELFVEIDFAAFFDQFELSPEVRPHFCFRAAGQFWQLTRLPMGARFGPGVAQYVTWLLVFGIADERVQVCTCIDNIRLSSDCLERLRDAYQIVMGRAQRLNITVNDHTFPTPTPAKSLGEKISRNAQGKLEVSLTDAHADALRNAQPDCTWTKRRIASLAGLTLYCAAVSNARHLHLSQRSDFLRAYSAFFAVDEPWDSPSSHTASLLPHLARFIHDVVAQPPVGIPPVPTLPPKPTLAAYDTIIFVDACSTGWAAYVCRRKDTTLLQQRFVPTVRYSAHAEPLAARLTLAWLHAHCPDADRVAVVTDHEALVSGQRRALSGFGGHSTAYQLSAAYGLAYSRYGRTEFFHIEGAANPADAPSRSAHKLATDAVVACVVDVVLDTTSATHPFAAVPRPAFMV
jgi:hypothetical protein